MEKIPDCHHIYFGKINEVIKTKKGSVLIAERIRNSDGTPSLDLEQSKIADEGFWNHLDTIERIFLAYGIPHFGIGAGNVMIKHNEMGGLHPVIVDYKKIGARFLPFQPWLNLEYFASKKVGNLFKKLKASYKPV